MWDYDSFQTQPGKWTVSSNWSYIHDEIISPEHFRKLQELNQQEETETKSKSYSHYGKKIEKCLLCIALQILLFPSWPEKCLLCMPLQICVPVCPKFILCFIMCTVMILHKALRTFRCLISTWSLSCLDFQMFDPQIPCDNDDCNPRLMLCAQDSWLQIHVCDGYLILDWSIPVSFGSHVSNF